MNNVEIFKFGEELANSITHGIGALLSVAALVLLIVFSSIHGNPWYIVSFTIYGSTLVTLYTISTLYHSFPKSTVKSVFEILDHSSIFLLIAGTYTPFTLISLRGSIGWTIFGTIWGLAAAGIIFKVFFIKKFVVISTLLYIVMGWMVVFVLKNLVESLPKTGLIFLIIGGVLYTIGTVFYIQRKIPYHHTIWHIFVLGGSIFHFFAVLSLL